jgi:lipoprotein-anchoring transpeptidase ErfK/SrfK
MTEDGFPEVYLVLARLKAGGGPTWLKIALPMRPNGTTGWVVRGALGKLQRVRTWLVIDLSQLRARFYDHGRRLWSARVGIGKASTPTPTGLFWVREEFELANQAFYGPYAFGTSAYADVSDWPGGGVVGLHGTSLPQLIPGRPSHGCVRFRNTDILWLAYHMPVGTPISIVR